MNRLANEKSPYLLQHADNPVDWYPWGDEAFAVAQRENKPIFLSIGYSTCHWCHVMEHESFESHDVAAALNRDFVSIKVDREERPDIDNIYMTIVQEMTGQGGWPMSVWLTPDRLPFFAGTFFSKMEFLIVLNGVETAWREKQGLIRQDVAQVRQALALSTALIGQREHQAVFDQSVMKAFLIDLESKFDKQNGGFGKAPKFPQSMSLMALMRMSRRSRDRHPIDHMVRTTLDFMCRGGIYDHAAGGFHRYSTDACWLVPHFEKMLYDQAWLTLTYLEAYQYYADDEYARVARETLDYVLREMSHPEGGYYSAQDADSPVPGSKRKKEGYFATYDYKELEKELTKDELEALTRIYGVRPKGHFEGRNILSLQHGFNRASREQDATARRAFDKLRRLRFTHPAPQFDDKVLVAWNGWMLAAMAKGAQVLNEPRYLESAKQAAGFVLKNLWRDDVLYRRWRDGEAKVRGLADDHAALIYGLLLLYETDFDPMWLEKAIELQKRMDTLFWDEEMGGYFVDDGSDPTLIIRAKETFDGVVPNANSLAALNLQQLHGLTFDEDFENRALRLFESYLPILKMAPAGLPMMLVAADYYFDSSKEIAIVTAKERGTDDALRFARKLQKLYSPNQVIAIGTGDESISLLSGRKPQQGQTTVYVCEDRTCRQPSTDLGKAISLTENFRPLES